MPSLFSSLVIGNLRLPNRLVMNAHPSGYAVPDGFFGEHLIHHYLRCAQGGVALVVLEPTCVLPPHGGATPHVGLYADVHVPDLHRAIAGIHQAGAAVLVMLDQPLWTAQLTAGELAELRDAFVAAAWRARAAGADGVMLSTADGGPFEQLLSPLRNQRSDQYGGDVSGRLRLLCEVVEGIARWLGSQFVVGVRLLVEEFTPGGLNLQDARMIATRLGSAGARLLEISAEAAGETPVARFPGWRVPLAHEIKAVSNVPIMVGGLLDDPFLADSVIGEGSADLIAIGRRLMVDPDWPRMAWAALSANEE